MLHVPKEARSAHFLKTKLCLGCVGGFEIIDIENLETQSLLDPSDPLLNDFVLRRERAVPLALYRVDSDFMVCDQGALIFASLFANFRLTSFILQTLRSLSTSPDAGQGLSAESNGKGLLQTSVSIFSPLCTSLLCSTCGHSQTVLRYPYLLAFSPKLIEIWNISSEKGELCDIIRGTLLYPLCTKTTVHAHRAANVGGGEITFKSSSGQIITSQRMMCNRCKI